MNRSLNIKRRQGSGFTLVELLLAITLMSILLGLTYSGLRAASRSSERGEQLLAAGGGMRAAHQFVRKQLNQMLPLPFAIAGENDMRVVFEGDSSHIQYVAPMPGYLGAGGPQVQRIEIVPGDDNNVMIQLSHALLQGFDESYMYERDPVILLEGIRSAGFEFLGKDDEGNLGNWVAYWDDQAKLPVAVRLHVEYEENLNLGWPDLVAGVKIDEEAIIGGAVEGGRAAYKKAVKDMLDSRDSQ